MAHKSLYELYETGRMLRLENGDDHAELWIAKLEDPDHQAATRKANGAKAERLRAARDKTSEEFVSLCTDFADLDRDVLISLLVESEVASRRAVHEEELAGDEHGEWAKDNYLEGLRTAWNDELKKVHAGNPDDPRAKHVYDEIARFVAEVDQRVDEDTAVARLEFEALDPDEVLDRVVTMLLTSQAQAAWLDGYYDAIVWLSARDPIDHRKHLFASMDEAKTIPNAHEVRAKIIATYQEIVLDLLPGGREGKDSPAQPASSLPSDSPAPAAV